jgi:quinol-cytochrome oxidoreductase complex cytochrome b subunit
VLFLLLAVTGALLLVVYEPSPERAYGTVARLVDEVPFGALVRNAHHWAANGLVLVTLLHLLRVFYRGGHLPPRRGNWFVGVALLLLVVGCAFTGYLLPWDQLAFWAVTISTGMLDYVPLVGATLLRAARGGADVGPSTLARFFVLHVAILPIALLVLLAFHFWLVRKVGGVILPADVGDRASPRGALVPTSPDLTQREGAAALVVMATVMLAAALWNAPLLAQANPGMSPNPAKAPWYFMGLQELLVHLHPVLGAVVLPSIGIALLLALPAMGGPERPSGRWFGSPRGARHALVAAIASALATAAAVVANEPFRTGKPWLGTIPPGLRSGALPLALAALVLLGVAWLSRRRGASRQEAVQAAFTFALASFAVLTVVGVVFRGPGMALGLP